MRPRLTRCASGPFRTEVCLERSACEALCASLPECASIDMHRELPRCYLNARDMDCQLRSAAALLECLDEPRVSMGAHTTCAA